MSELSRKKLDYIDYFRAIAIFFIVAGHTLVWGKNTMHEFNALLLASGTYFFVFISGFLFMYLSYKFNIKEYFKKKLINFLMPCLITMLPAALLYSFQNIDNRTVLQSARGIIRLFAAFTGPWIVNLPLWFVGMIAIMFLFSPLFLYLRKTHKKIYITLFLCSVIFTLTLGRTPYPIGQLNELDYANWTVFFKIIYINTVYHFKNFLHFISFYLLGMEICNFIQKEDTLVKRNLKSIFQISLFLYIFHFVVQVFIFKTVPLRQIISKFIAIFVLLSGLILTEEKIKKIKFLDKTLKFLSQYSFGIFFIHFYLLLCMTRHSLLLVEIDNFFIVTNKNTFKCLFNSLELFLVAFFGSILILFILRTILLKLGIKNTRKYIGV